MNSSKWIKLNPETIAPPERPADALWSFESPSPYDVPSHAKSIFNSESGFLVIKFKYFEPESLEEVSLGNYISAKVGKKTKRVWSIQFDVHSYSRGRKKIEDSAIHYVERTKSASNGAIAAKAISSKSESLLQAAFG